MYKILIECIKKKDVINITLINLDNTYILNDIIYLDSSTKNDNIFKTIISANKPIFVKFDSSLFSYKNIDILSYVNEMTIPEFHNDKKILILDKSTNLERLKINCLNGLTCSVIDKLCEKQFLKYIEMKCKIDIDLNDIFRIIEIKSLNTLYLKSDIYSLQQKIDTEKTAKILYYIVNNLNKYMKIIMDFSYFIDVETKYSNLIKYNFKIEYNNYIFNYVPISFRKFNNLYDLDLFY